MGSVLLAIVVVLVIAYCGWGLILLFIQPKLLYGPAREVECTPRDIGLEFEDVIFRSSDGLELTGWYIPVGDGKITILFCHGNGGNIMHRLDSISIFHNLGLNCFLFDYRGYGNSEGKTTEAGTYLDTNAAYNWLINQRKTAPNNIIIFGRSLGGSIAAELATKVEAKGLVIESTFTSYVDMGRNLYFYMLVRWFARFRYSTIDYIKQVHCPVMVIHSKDDEIVPFDFGLKLHEAANEPKEFVEIYGSHNDGFLVSGEIYEKAWLKWLEFLQKR
jgi:fermentation-respiration switch protein FrsA (DUF1100 family)